MTISLEVYQYGGIACVKSYPFQSEKLSKCQNQMDFLEKKVQTVTLRQTIVFKHQVSTVINYIKHTIIHYYFYFNSIDRRSVHSLLIDLYTLYSEKDLSNLNNDHLFKFK